MTPVLTEPCRLQPAIRRYAWGSVDALPTLLGEPPTGEPLAELWYGAHPSGSAAATVEGVAIGLDELVEPGQLPFMVKLIAAAEPLSIQVHPSAARAAARHAAEISARVPLGERRYADGRAKPEILCALTGFDALIEFRPAADIVRDLESTGLTTLADDLRAGGLRALIRHVLRADAVAVRSTIDALVATGNELTERLATLYPADPGAIIATFLNRIRLQPGQAVFLGPGTVHAYLGGTGVEMMSMSDNVLRAGLTSKLVDVEEFLEVARLESCEPDVLDVADEGTFPPRAEEFRAVRFRGGTRVVKGPALIVCTSGSVDVDGLTLRPGGGAFVPPTVSKASITGTGEAYIAMAGSDGSG